MDAVRLYLDKHFIQIADIDLSDYGSWEPIGTRNNPFTGVYDGGGHRIANVSITTSANTACYGLFTSLNNAVVMRVLIDGFETSGSGLYIGAIAGEAYDSSRGLYSYPSYVLKLCDS